MTGSKNSHVCFSRFPDIGGLELLHAAFKKHSFSPHYHEGHVIGVIEKGNLGFDYHGEKMVASCGEINIADPGEVHNGFGVSDQGWQYRMFYMRPGQLDRISNEVCDKNPPMPFFKKGIIKDREFAIKIHQLHKDLENPGISLLEKESRFYSLFSKFILRHSQFRITPLPAGSEPGMVSTVKAYIRAHFNERISLQDLSREAGVSRYYLLRVFARQTGLTPHAYLNYTRASMARQMIKDKVPIIESALCAGFYDQSHLNRVFKKIYGITPGQYLSAL